MALLGYIPNNNPIAQSFYVDRSSGIFISQVDLYFNGAPLADASGVTYPVSLEIRPMVNGAPSATEAIPGSLVTVSQATVLNSVSGNATVACPFVFDAPLHLPGLHDYAIVVSSNNKFYSLWTGAIGEFEVGSVEKKIDTNPVSGSIFYTQNGVTFTPDQNRDLTFRLHKCVFSTEEKTMVLHNAPVGKKLLNSNPVLTTNGQSDVLIGFRYHGLLVGDEVLIEDVTGTIGGIPAASINGVKSVTGVDWRSIKIATDTTATSSDTGGGLAVYATRQIQYNGVHPNIQTIIPKNTVVESGIRTTSGKSFAGTETGYVKDSLFSPIELNKTTYSNTIKLISADRNSPVVGGEPIKTADMIFAFRSSSPDVSPVVDLQRVSLTTIGFEIDNQDSSATVGFNVPLLFTPETASTGGSSASKHITREIRVPQSAVGLNILLSANRPSGTSFDVYYRIAVDDEDIFVKNWVYLTEETNNSVDNNPRSYREYRYLAGGSGGVLPAFTKYQVKIVMNSTNQAVVPTFRDMRIIALGV
jgi:hypothetical protein